MSLWKKILLGLGAIILALVVAFLTLIGPWPTYKAGFEGTGYFEDAIAAIEENVKESEITSSPGRLKVGWGSADITPDVGTPMAGYGDRQGAPSVGVHDHTWVKALAFSDGKDTAVIVGADMLLVPENVAALVREQVAERTPLTPNDIHFGASHTHAGCGAFGPGLAAYVTGGKYDPAIPGFLASGYTEAIVEAYESLEPGKVANGSIDAPQFIKNRTRKAPVDSELSYLVAEQDDGDRCFLVSFSAHPTVLGGKSNMLITAEYPGFLQRFIEGETGETAVYLGGALGSMGYQAPEAPDRFARSQALGEGLAKLVLEDAKELEFRDTLDVASIGVPLELPPYQVRPLSAKWRVSKFTLPLAGVNTSGWMQAVRIGDIVFVGVPADFSGEISVKWKQWGKQHGYDLWTSSFCADYAGYVSPDEYYYDVVDEKGNPEYETGLMSWCGPHQEAYFTALMEKLVTSMEGPATEQKAQRETSAGAHG